MRIIDHKAVEKLEKDKAKISPLYLDMNPEHAELELAYAEKHSALRWELTVSGKFVGYAGIVFRSHFEPVYFWLLPVSLSQRSVVIGYKDFSRRLHKTFRNVVTFVKKDWDIGYRFAAFCGFEKTEQEVIMYDQTFVIFVGRK